MKFSGEMKDDLLFSLCQFNRFHRDTYLYSTPTQICTFYTYFSAIIRYLFVTVRLLLLFHHLLLFHCHCRLCLSYVVCSFFSRTIFEFQKKNHCVWMLVARWKTILWAYKAYCVCVSDRMRMPVRMWFGCFSNGIMRNEYEIVYYYAYRKPNFIRFVFQSPFRRFFHVCFYTFLDYFFFDNHT